MSACFHFQCLFIRNALKIYKSLVCCCKRLPEMLTLIPNHNSIIANETRNTNDCLDVSLLLECNLFTLNGIERDERRRGKKHDVTGYCQ